MAKGPMYVKDFNFSSAGKTVSRCDDGMTKMASGGYYSKGGSAKAGQSVQMAKSNAVAKSLVGQKATPYAKGGMKEPATGEKYPSRRAMMKHESMETPRMQKDEIMQSRMVKAPMRRAMPVAPAAPMIQPGAMKKGGFVPGGTGMVKTEGTLGIKGNKNPGERNGKPTMATKTGNVPYKKGGKVNKYAFGGRAAPVSTGALNQVAAQQAQRRQQMPTQPIKQPPMGRQMPPQPMPNRNVQQQNLSGQQLRPPAQGMPQQGAGGVRGAELNRYIADQGYRSVPPQQSSAQLAEQTARSAALAAMSPKEQAMRTAKRGGAIALSEARKAAKK